MGGKEKAINNPSYGEGKEEKKERQKLAIEKARRKWAQQKGKSELAKKRKMKLTFKKEIGRSFPCNRGKKGQLLEKRKTEVKR